MCVYTHIYIIFEIYIVMYITGTAQRYCEFSCTPTKSKYCNKVSQMNFVAPSACKSYVCTVL